MTLQTAVCSLGLFFWVGCSSAEKVIDAGSDGCKPVSADAGTSHSTVTSDETWTEAGNPHLIPFDININTGATVHLASCAVVRIAPAAAVSVVGSLVADGTPQRPVLIERLDSTRAWAALRASGGTIRLTNTTVKGGGDPLNYSPPLAAMLDINGTQSLPTQPVLFVDHVTLLDSASQGVFLHGGGGFAPDSVALTISGSASYPIHSWSRSAGTIPSGTYTGNGTDELLLTATGLAESISEDVTFHDRGVPYHVGSASSAGTLYIIKAGGLATLTIEPGVTLRFKKGGVMYVESNYGSGPATGALIAVGTQAKPIIFTSAEAVPAAGDWFGVYFGSIAAPTSRMEWARVEYAGGDSVGGNASCPYPGGGIPNAAIRILGGAPATQFITSTTILKSAKHGIDRGWRDALRTDFLPTNTFTDVAGCFETYPPDMNNVCPAVVPCPK